MMRSPLTKHLTGSDDSLKNLSRQVKKKPHVLHISLTTLLAFFLKILLINVVFTVESKGNKGCK